jgi:hypothetical protein
MVNYTLTIENGDNGTTDPDAGEHVYAAGSVVVVESIPDAVDYGLDYWTVDEETVGTANAYTITMDGDYTLKAFFTLRNPSSRRNRIRRNRGR